MKQRPRPALILTAIEKVEKTEKGHELVIRECLTGTSVDAAYLFIRTTQKIREKQSPWPTGHALRQLVEEVVRAADLEPGRARAYVLIAMRYYLLVKQYRDRVRRLRKLPRAARTAARTAQPLFVLVA